MIKINFGIILLLLQISTLAYSSGCHTGTRNYPHIVEDRSFQNLSWGEKRRYLDEFYIDFCKIPAVYRSFFETTEMEIYVTAGPITLNPFLRDSVSGDRPRNHNSGTYDDLPGVSANWGKLVVLNLLSLQAGHGAKSLVIHEVAHSLDYLYGRRKVSDQRTFKRHFRKTPWDELYRETPLLNPESDIPEGFILEKDIIKYREYIEESNKASNDTLAEKIRYHKGNREEHFAELFGMWYLGGSTKIKLRRLMPQMTQYFSDLEVEIRELDINRKREIQQERLANQLREANNALLGIERGESLNISLPNRNIIEAVGDLF